MKVLIVDSSVMIIERLEEILTETGNISVFLKAESYVEASKLFKDNKPDAVLLDCSLRENGSQKLLKEFKKEGSKTMVIILTIREDIYMREQCKLLGADFIIDKFYDFEKISGAIKTIAAQKN